LYSCNVWTATSSLNDTLLYVRLLFSDVCFPTILMHCQMFFFVQDEDLPTVFAAIFIEYRTAFMEDFFQHFADLIYPKKRIDLFIHYAVRCVLLLHVGITSVT
jgi:hypothetical protein